MILKFIMIYNTKQVMDNSLSITVKSKDGSKVDMSDVNHSILTLFVDTNRVYIDLKLVNIPQNVKHLTIGDNLAMSISRSIYLPRMLEYYKGPILYDMEIPSSVKTIVSINTSVSQDSSLLSIDEDVDFTVVDLKSYNISSDNPTSCSPVKLDNVRIVHSPLVQDAILEKKPHLNHLEVSLNDEITNCIDIWDKILLGGSIVNKMTIISQDSNVLSNLYLLFDTGRKLGKESITIKILNGFDENDTIYLLNIAKSLIDIHWLTLEIEYTDYFTEDLLYRISTILKCKNYVYSTDSFIFSSFFGATDSRVYIKGSKLVIERKQCPRYFKFMEEPVSSSLIVPMELSRRIKLYTWTKCGYCKKQESIIDNFRNRSIKSAKLFDDNVEIISVDDPSEITDSRISAFPTWLINDEVNPGVKDEMMINLALTTI